ncbi:NIPSNAP family protein [Chloroflexota bacterium]
MVYEMLIVNVVPGKLKEFHDLWLKESLPIWGKHGIEHAGSWETTVGNANEVVRIFGYKDMAHYEQWTQFIQTDEAQLALRRKLWTYIASINRRLMRPY